MKAEKGRAVEYAFPGDTSGVRGDQRCCCFEYRIRILFDDHELLHLRARGCVEAVEIGAAGEGAGVEDHLVPARLLPRINEALHFLAEGVIVKTWEI